MKYIDVDTAITVTVNVAALTDNTDFITAEEAIAYNAAGMSLVWNFETTAGVITQTAFTPTTAGVHDWTHVGKAVYKVEIPASAGTINNDTEGFGYISGTITGVLNFTGPSYGFRAAALNDQLIDSQDSGDYPATRTSISNIGASTGGGLTFAPSEDNTGGAIDPSSAAFVGSVSSGTFSSTGPGTTNSHSINDSGDDIDVVYGYQVGGNRQGTILTVFADVDGGADRVNVKIYDHVAVAWITVGEIGNDDLLSVPLTAPFTGTSSELGKVYVRFETDSTTPSNLRVWECLVSAVQVDSSIGYSNGTIWIDTITGVAGTENHVNGTGDNPSDSLADATTISSSIGIKRFEIAPASSITFAASETQKIYKGDGWNLTLNGADISDTHIHGAHAVSGICTATSLYVFEHCVFTDVTLNSGGYVHISAIKGTLTLGNAGSYHLHNCFADSNTGVIVDFNGVGVSVLHIHGFEGKITFKNMDANHNVHCGGGGQIFTDTCTGGQIHHFGQFRYTDVGGNVTDIQSDIENNVDEILIDTAAITPGGDATEAKQDTIIANLATVDGIVDAVLVDTNEIGTAGAGLTDLGGMSSAMKAEVNVEADSAITDASLATSSNLTTVDTNVNAILIDTGVTLPSSLSAIDSNVDAILVDTSASIPSSIGVMDAKIDIVDTNVDSVLVDTGITIPASIDTLPTVAEITADIDSNSTQLAALLVDTGTDIPALIGALNDLSSSEVNTEVLDVMTVDTHGELSGPPSATSSILDKISWVFSLSRNRLIQTPTLLTLRNVAENGDIATATVSDDGSEAIRDKFV